MAAPACRPRHALAERLAPRSGARPSLTFALARPPPAARAQLEPLAAQADDAPSLAAAGAEVRLAIAAVPTSAGLALDKQRAQAPPHDSRQRDAFSFASSGPAEVLSITTPCQTEEEALEGRQGLGVTCACSEAALTLSACCT